MSYLLEKSGELVAPAKERRKAGWGRRARPALLLGLLGLGVACSPIRLLQPGQRLLARTEIKGAEQADREQLANLIQQKPNTTFPLPKLAIYQLGYTFYNRPKLEKKLAAIQADFTRRLAAAGTDSAKLGKLLARRERLVNRKQLALDRGNAIMRLGEPPVVYEPELTGRSVEQLTTYLHSQGFFRARVSATDTAQTRRGLIRGPLYALGLRKEQPRHDSTGAVRPHRRVTVTYHVTENQPFVYSQLTRSIPDSGVARVVRLGQGESLLKVGERYDENRIGEERTRLETLLKNAGYYDFRQQYISLEADTSFAPFTVRLRTLIANPGPGEGHRLYRLRNVTMITDAGARQVLRNAAGGSGVGAPGDTLRRVGTARELGGPPRVGGPLRIPRDTTYADSLRYASYDRLAYSTRVLSRKITLRPGQPYTLRNTLSTQRQLANLDMFRFNTVSYRKVEPAGAARPDSLARAGQLTDVLEVAPPRPAEGQLDAVINASPSKKFTETTEFGGTYVAEKPGPFVNLRLKWRNPFGGAEVLELGTRVGFEGQYTRVGGVQGSSVYTTQFGATAALVLPQFLVPWRTGRYLTRYNPKTRFSLSDTYVNRPEYTRTNLEFSYDYLWQTSAYHQYAFSPVVLNIINATTSDSYQLVLDDLRRQGSPLYRSFAKLFVPSIAFTSLYNSNDFNQTRDAHYLRIAPEVGGLTRGLYRERLPGFDLKVYDFARLNVDYRRYHHLTAQTFLVWRLNGGIAHALTRTDGQYVIPYDKFFFAGGSTSLRAWQPRRLGPGSYTSYLASKPTERDYISEQPGELLLEGSVEYRFPIYSFVKGALFTDFGNVWSLQQDARPGAQFQASEFYHQIAVGSGLGVRFDFSFLILRLDMATKVYDPTAPAGQKWALRNFDTRANEIAFNLGIGYPF